VLYLSILFSPLLRGKSIPSHNSFPSEMNLFVFLLSYLYEFIHILAYIYEKFYFVSLNYIFVVTFFIKYSSFLFFTILRFSFLPSILIKCIESCVHDARNRSDVSDGGTNHI